MQQEVKEKILTSKADLFCILESRIRSSDFHVSANQIFPCNWHNFSNISLCSYARIWITWKDDIDITILKTTDKVIFCQTIHPSENKPLICCIYAANYPQSRLVLWNDIMAFSACHTEPCIFLGEFNCIQSAQEKIGGAHPN